MEEFGQYGRRSHHSDIISTETLVKMFLFQEMSVKNWGCSFVIAFMSSTVVPNGHFYSSYFFVQFGFVVPLGRSEKL